MDGKKRRAPIAVKRSRRRVRCALRRYAREASTPSAPPPAPPEGDAPTLTARRTAIEAWGIAVALHRLGIDLDNGKLCMDDNGTVFLRVEQEKRSVAVQVCRVNEPVATVMAAWQDVCVAVTHMPPAIVDTLWETTMGAKNMAALGACLFAKGFTVASVGAGGMVQ